MQKVIRSRQNCSNRLIIPNIRNLQYFGLYSQFSASIHTYHQDLWVIYARENSFFDGFITHSPTISNISNVLKIEICMSEIPSHCIVTKYRKKSVVFGDTDWIDLLT